jgi:hypothetical protein
MGSFDSDKIEVIDQIIKLSIAHSSVVFSGVNRHLSDINHQLTDAVLSENNPVVGSALKIAGY